MSADKSNKNFAWYLKKSPRDGWVAEKALFQSHLDCGKSITQILVGEGAGKLILSIRNRITNGTSMVSRTLYGHVGTDRTFTNGFHTCSRRTK
ncbi:uncharacterized protein Z518_03266 [Rhinocladiella mackenziei CBS 650.93]|uniref:Uncharacterized protein n=1 Tax=Rhinocladiella mackenziei CBS 650.93 TaxID=1442369 RepID=A0A0D2JGZ0_9EURO|nr:uncharacterized protein Z518_03266 [Rhinocladiella mackenziei CBS 650.93]KIX08610.1 hypothetical protein Z518_03266 [Rhinocladiella mackenziei CBS 650.93]